MKTLSNLDTLISVLSLAFISSCLVELGRGDQHALVICSIVVLGLQAVDALVLRLMLREIGRRLQS